MSLPPKISKVSSNSTQYSRQSRLTVLVDHNLLESAIRLASERAIAAEPSLTKWDMILGDGDCGEGVKGVCMAIIAQLDSGSAKSGSIPQLLQHVIAAVDDMGGSLGAILGILVAALASHLRTNIISSGQDNAKVLDVLAKSLWEATQSLMKHTGARVGDRTVMDVLIPFSQTLSEKKDLKLAVDAAVKAAEGTKDLKPSFGRASYVELRAGDEQRVPDPGAWALMEMVKGIYDATK